jgi:putative hydrolase of the HAD superfamily
MPGLYDVFAALKHAHWRIGVVSNGAQESRHRAIDGLHLWEHLDVMISSGGVGINKPDPRIFALALHRLHGDSSPAWFVGDHPLNDIVGAQRAGLQAIWLTGFHDWPAHLPKPRWKITQLREILDILPGFGKAG